MDFQKDALTYMKNCLSNRLQRVRVKSTFTSWDKIFSGVSILGPLLFNIFTFHNKLQLEQLCDDLTLYASGQKLEEIKQILHCDFEKVTKLSYENNMVLNQGKCQIMRLEKTLKTKPLFLKTK